MGFSVIKTTNNRPVVNSCFLHLIRHGPFWGTKSLWIGVINDHTWGDHHEILWESRHQNYQNSLWIGCLSLLLIFMSNRSLLNSTNQSVPCKTKLSWNTKLSWDTSCHIVSVVPFQLSAVSRNLHKIEEFRKFWTVPKTSLKMTFSTCLFRKPKFYLIVALSYIAAYICSNYEK